MQPQLIAGRYQVLRAIGRGGMGTVWLCRDEILGREVAVKQIGVLPGESATETKRAMREARSAAALNHPNAVAVYDVVNHDERPWLVMEYVEGHTLADEITRDGRLSPPRVADIGAQLAGALAVAHERRIVHRDIKPGNVLIDKTGHPKISDFGIARMHGDDQLTQTGFVTGTPGYLSPELARGSDPDSASDVWALGATLYAAVEGQPPYESRSNPIALLMAIATEQPRPMTHPGALGPAIHAMMDADPALRWDMATSAQRLGGIAGAIAGGDATAAMSLIDPGATQVIAALPVEPTQRLELVGEGELGGGAPVPPPDDRRSGRSWLPLVFVALLLVAALGVGYLLSQLSGQGGATPVAGATSATTPASTAPTTAPSTSSAPSSSPTAASDPAADRQLANFVSSYYSDVTKDTDRTWDQLTSNMQDAVGGRDGYDSFWKSIDKVKVNQIQANASTKTAIVNLTFTRDHNSESTETHQLTFVTEGKDYFIDTDQFLG